MFKGIVVDPEICEGKPYIKGKRIPVSVIVRLVACGMNFSEIIEAYPYLEKEDIKEAFEFAAILTDGKAIPLT